MTDDECAAVRELLAELALGVLEGRERSDVVDHVARCPACQRELTTLGMVVDQLVAHTPAAEPPVGFEARVLERLTPPVERIRPRRRRTVALRAAVIALLAGASATGGWVVGHQGPAAPLGPSSGRAVLAASFVEDGHVVGRVLAYAGAHPWVTMTIDARLRVRTVHCELIERDGATLVAGEFTVDGDYGSWGVRIATRPSNLRAVELLDAAGRPVATALF